MDEQSEKVIIIGAGVAGLVAALELEKARIPAVIIENSDQAGGRVKTFREQGYLLDRGFQVLLTAYPEAQRYLDYEALELKTFDPGAIIFRDGKKMSFYDPLRTPSKLFHMAFSSVGTLKDKWKLFELNKELKALSIDEIFQGTSETTIQYLKNYGFSEQLIDNFFKPFFRGIFLENELNTPSPMFRFVFKMFSEGMAAVPAKGMQAIPHQLVQKLQQTELRYNTKVKSVLGTKVTMEDGEELQGRAVIVATNPEGLIPALQGQIDGFHAVTCLYFSMPESLISKPMIALVPEDKYMINNFCFLNEVSPDYTPGRDALLSVSVIGETGMQELEVIEKVKHELVELLGPEAEKAIPLETYLIKQALPVLDNVSNTMAYTATQVYENVFLAGDYLLNGSLNAAMTSGRNAAEAVIMARQTIR